MTGHPGGTGPERPLQVTQLRRRTFPGHFSVERVFDQLRPALEQQGYAVHTVVARHFSLGLWPRLRTALDAARLGGPVVHVTGDITFAAALRRRRGTVVTVLDTEFLDRASGPKRLVYTWLWLRLPVWRAQVVTVLTEATRRDLEAVVKVRRGKVRVVPVPVSPLLVAPPGSGAHPLGAPPVVLLVGTRPNKNLPRALTALTGLDCRVVLIGRPDSAQEAAIVDSGLPVEVREDLDDGALRACYDECDVVLFASTKEGFGIPVLEGQAMGRPVVTSDRPPMSDVAGPGGAALVDPWDPASIRAGVERVLGDEAYRTELVAQGRANVAAYTPEAVAAAYGAIYDEVAARGTRPGAGTPRPGRRRLRPR